MKASPGPGVGRYDLASDSVRVSEPVKAARWPREKRSNGCTPQSVEGRRKLSQPGASR